MTDLANRNVTNRDLQAIATRQKIFDTAFQMITEHGFDNVTIADICKQSNVAKGLFYHYFNSKDDIVIETYKIVDERYSQEIMHLPIEMNSIEKIIFTVTFQAHYAIEKGVAFVRQIYKSQLDTGTTFFISPERAFFKLIQEAVIAGQMSNQIRTDISPDEFTRLILSISRGIIYDWCLNDGTYNIESVMNTHFRILVGSFTPDAWTIPYNQYPSEYPVSHKKWYGICL